MKAYAITVLVCAMLAYAGIVIADNLESFSSATAACSTIDRLVKHGATDADTQTIKRLLQSLARVRPLLTDAQQSVLWQRYPWFSGIACYWPVGHAWHGNDCASQCGNLQECKEVIK